MSLLLYADYDQHVTSNSKGHLFLNVCCSNLVMYMPEV